MKTTSFLNKIKDLILFSGIFTLILLLNSCTLSFSRVMNKGYVQSSEFMESANFDIVLGLIIVPVEINGKTYRFLFDTGATTCISNEVDDVLNKKTIYKGGLKDSDNNRTVVKYISIDSLNIGGATFYEQSAFVTDFDKNPILKCMELDGILGSNTMRHCNWTINYELQEMVLTSHALDSLNKFAIPFKTDRQFNIKVDLKLSELNITNLKIDYGSNGSLSLPKSIISELIEKGAITKTTTQTGFSQSGITGKVSKIEDLIAFSDSLYSKDLVFRNIPIRTGNGLIGGKIFSNWIVDIDWDQQRLYFSPQENQKDYSETFGMFINYSPSKGAFIQSIIKGSEADSKGILPEMTVLSLNNIHFNNETDFCQYITDDTQHKDITLVLKDLKGDTIQLKMHKSPIQYK